jgi:hypothetical protein
VFRTIADIEAKVKIVIRVAFIHAIFFFKGLGVKEGKSY